MTVPVHHTAVAARAERPERGGGPRQIQADVPERVYCGGNPMADLAGDVRLQSSSEDLVNDAAAVVWIVGFFPIVIFAVSVQHIKSSDEELVSVLLLVAGEMSCVSPDQVQQPEGNVRRAVTRVELLKELRHFTHQAGVGLHLTLVSVGQEEVPQQWSVCESLNDAVHKARVPKVYQTPQSDGAVGCNLPSFGVVSQQLQLSFRRLPHRIFLSNPLQFPCFSLFFFGNLLHVFVVYVILAHKAVYSTVQKVYS